LLFLTLHISDEKEIDWKNIKKRLTHQYDNYIRGKKGGEIMKVKTKVRAGFNIKDIKGCGKKSKRSKDCTPDP